MRVLLYTATAFFTVLAGVFTFYAIRGPEHPSGAKVVLSIDAREAPGGAIDSAAEPERDVYAEAAAQLQSRAGNERGEDAAAADEADADVGRRGASGETASSEAAQIPGLEAEGESEDIAALPPGTALEGGDRDRRLRNGTSQGEDVADASREPAAAETSLPSTRLDAGQSAEAGQPDAIQQPGADASAGSLGLRPRQDGAADGAPATEGGQKPALDAILATLNERDAEAGDGPASISAPAGPPPPLPLRRSDAKTAALNAWGSTQITKADGAGAKPARIAILLRGLGRDDRNSGDAVTKLPPAISLAFMPFVGAQPWAKKAAEQGHEVIVQLPLEPSDYPVTNPGPETLLASSAPEENASRLGAILRRFDGYSGVTNFLGGRMLQSKAALRPILQDIKARGLIYIGEGNNNTHAVVRGLAGEIGLRYGGANVMIDAQPTPAAIQAALERLVAIARKEGSAIGLGYASRATIDQLAAWSQTLAAQAITLVPVGTLAQTPGAS
jgi:polysaccharide deacetylase 2 family uncharacterized protein YibQ